MRRASLKIVAVAAVVIVRVAYIVAAAVLVIVRVAYIVAVAVVVIVRVAYIVAAARLSRTRGHRGRLQLKDETRVVYIVAAAVVVIARVAYIVAAARSSLSSASSPMSLSLRPSLLSLLLLSSFSSRRRTRGHRSAQMFRRIWKRRDVVESVLYAGGPVQVMNPLSIFKTGCVAPAKRYNEILRWGSRASSLSS